MSPSRPRDTDDADFAPVPLNYDELNRPKTASQRREVVRVLWERHVLADLDEESRRLPPPKRARTGVSTILPVRSALLPLPSKPQQSSVRRPPPIPGPPRPRIPSKSQLLAARVRTVGSRPIAHPTADVNLVVLPFPPDVTAGQLHGYLDTKIGRVVHCRLSDGVACVTLAARGKGAIEACRILNDLAVDGCRLNAFPVHAVRFNRPEARRQS
ncbi:uncharacterized protein LOC62_05G006905 [Vanrija pseudolonga]|uniref:Uncharacterized protein n=1 Tax=Vanrija pseudolonga TaxID=143232 RepID=A0AAF0YB35_9TREE|nr:hypothetical protein LOC62_05G006905 [Vanrija pseudolonga]